MVTSLSASESPLPTSPERPKVIYVMGAGRSGSTILGVVLGNCTNVFDAGEARRVATTVGDPELRWC